MKALYSIMIWKVEMHMSVVGDCDSCNFYSYDEEYECYMCDVNMDEDELVRFLADERVQCPYYQSGDEYRIVRKQGL